MSVRVAFQPTDAPNGVDEVRLAPRSERPLQPRSPQTVAHDAAFPRDIPDILLTFLFLRQPASVANPLLRRAVSCLFYHPHRRALEAASAVGGRWWRSILFSRKHSPAVRACCARRSVLRLRAIWKIRRSLR